VLVDRSCQVKIADAEEGKQAFANLRALRDFILAGGGSIPT
jgi:hypothetical protein